MAITIKTLEALNLSAFLVYNGLGKNGKPLRASRIKRIQSCHISLPDNNILILLMCPDGYITLIDPKERNGNHFKYDWDFLKKLNEYGYPGTDSLLRKKLAEITLRDLRNGNKH